MSNDSVHHITAVLAYHITAGKTSGDVGAIPTESTIPSHFSYLTESNQKQQKLGSYQHNINTMRGETPSLMLDI